MAKAHLTAPAAPVNLCLVPGDYECGSLRLDPDTGLVRRVVNEDGDTEPCGFVDDEDACPPDLVAEWDELLDWWRDSLGYADACRRTAEAAWAARFDSRGW